MIKIYFFMNINENFLEEDGTLSAEVMPDFLHPYEVGYGIWSKAITPTLNKLMSDGIIKSESE